MERVKSFDDQISHRVSEAEFLGMEVRALLREKALKLGENFPTIQVYGGFKDSLDCLKEQPGIILEKGNNQVEYSRRSMDSPEKIPTTVFSAEGIFTVPLIPAVISINLMRMIMIWESKSEVHHIDYLKFAPKILEELNKAQEKVLITS